MSESVTKARRIYETNSQRPICDAQRLALECDPPISSSVARLFFTRGPLHIARLVVAVVVDSFNAVVFRWTSSDVCYKGRVVFPTIAHVNTARAVVCEGDMSRIPAPANHIDPDAVFLRMAPGTHVSVFCRFSRAHFTAQATTTTMAAIDQMVASGRDGFAAIATTQPPARFSALNGFGSAQYRQSSECLPGDVTCGSLFSSHAVASKSGDGVVRGWRALMTLVSLANYPTAVAA